MKKKQVTIDDIARGLNINKSTVSRALKGYPDISTATKIAVRDFAEKLGFKPNIMAQSLTTKRTFSIGVMVPDLVNQFFSTAISGIEDYAYRSGYRIMISQSNELYEREKENIEMLLAAKVDGVLVSLSCETKDIEHFRNLTEHGIPIVFFDRVISDTTINRVIANDYLGALYAVNFLISKGYKRIAHLGGPETLLICRERKKGFQDSLHNHGLKLDSHYIIHGNLDIQSGKNNMSKLLSLPEIPDCVFSANDQLAVGALMAIKEHGLKVPGDIALIGFSNEALCTVVEPNITSIDQHPFTMGQKAVELLIKQIENPELPNETIMVDTTLIERAST
jgi:LacI family transcriptional regulator